MSIVPISVSVCATAERMLSWSVTSSAHDVGVAALGLDLGAQALQPLDAPPGERDAGARLGQDARELRAEAARGAGDEGDAPRQIDLIAHESCSDCAP